MANDKDLPPEERIKKLKKLKEEKEKEIAEAQKLIKESEEELTDRRKFKEKVPIPESAKNDLEGLSKEGKEILKEQKGLREKVAEHEEKKAAAKTSKDDKKYDLESLAREQVELPPDVINSEYALQLSKEPMGNIYKEMGQIYKAVEEKGYISREEEKRVEYLSSAVERKIEADEEGQYSFSREAARAASITQQLGASLISTYKGHKSGLYRSS